MSRLDGLRDSGVAWNFLDWVMKNHYATKIMAI